MYVMAPAQIYCHCMNHYHCCMNIIASMIWRVLLLYDVLRVLHDVLLLHDLLRVLHDVLLLHEFYGCCMPAITAATAIELQLCCKIFSSAVSLQVLVVVTATACMLLTIGLRVITASADRHVLTVACM